MATDLHTATSKIASINPATGEVLRELGCCGGQEVLVAVQRAAAAPGAWAELGLKRRVAILHEFQTTLLRKKSEIAAAITGEAGKPVAEALVTEVLVVLDAARFLIDNAYQLLRSEPLAHGNLA